MLEGREITRTFTPDSEELARYSNRGFLLMILGNQLILSRNQGVLMATLADLQTQLNAIQAAETAEATDIATLGTALQQIIAMLQAAPDVPDAVVQQATDIATAAMANTTAAAGLAAEAQNAANPLTP